ncbi:hypothetical protein EHO61_11335 [Leptospira fluminis]|uniref:Uncharacterized protein n=2 Tax=Leptospira fluminis TaxID=2484979 RepID=A0A4R9GNH1_9LEPT|nr:hypothetical protein [Leptospira fluminis]TGK18043.1 hypothetical protein EHO61_11335 [Leptospira fluminis]
MVPFYHSGSAYPYGNYRVISGLLEAPYQNSIVQTATAGNPKQVTRTRYAKYRGTLALNFYSNSNIDDVWQAADKVLNWFSKSDHSDFCKSKGVVPKFLNLTVDDLSTFQNGAWSYLVSFLIRFDYTNEIVENLDAISSVGIQAQFGNHNRTITIGV